MNEERNMKLLNKIYKSAEMGVCALGTVCEKAEDDGMKACLGTQLHKYRALEAEIEREIRGRGGVPENSRFGIIGLKSAVSMNLMINKTPARIAKMVISGAYEDARNISREIDCRDARVRQLADKLVECDKTSATSMREYL